MTGSLCETDVDVAPPPLDDEAFGACNWFVGRISMCTCAFGLRLNSLNCGPGPGLREGYEYGRHGNSEYS